MKRMCVFALCLCLMAGCYSKTTIELRGGGTCSGTIGILIIDGNLTGEGKLTITGNTLTIPKGSRFVCDGSMVVNGKLIVNGYLEVANKLDHGGLEVGENATVLVRGEKN